MINVIKMDLYRMVKSRFTWIIFIIIGIFIAVSVRTQHRDYIYLLSVLETDSEMFFERFPLVTLDSGDEVVDTFFMFSHLLQQSIGYFLSFFVVLFSVLFTGLENSTGFIKNIAGQSAIRHRTIISKCFSNFVFSSMSVILTFVVTLISFKLFFGYVYFAMYSLPDMLIYTLSQMLLYAAFAILVMCMSLLIKNQAISMGIGALLAIGFTKIITNWFDTVFSINHFSFSSLLITHNRVALPLPYEFSAYQQAWTVGGSIILIAMAISILDMKKKDIL
ncbi:ABC transporter permease [Fusibacter sp. 3D3]|uniref:ABC transporter permease n=1 Tax=Fusibacter sp. 3D3 TaxID=1048380 RepID=UPI000852D9F1|nr:ABC transporter permease [Fusibacter sp. 3D3]GAU76698.1 hypothetical protein F3D3_1295 [Fusibacter sp. 3D3]